MHRVLSGSFFILLLLGGMSGIALAQSQPESLVEAARANRAQQQVQQASGAAPKVITNQDLPPGSTPPPQSDTSDSMTMVSGAKKSDPYSDRQLNNRLQGEQRTSMQWKARIEAQQNRITDLQARIDSVNASIRSSVGSAQYETPANRDQAIQMQRLAIMQETLNLQKRRLAMMEQAAQRSAADQ